MKFKTQPSVTAKEISAMISAQTTEFTIGKPGEKPISYVFVKDGLLEVRRTKVGIFSKMKTKSNVGGLADVITGLAKVKGISAEITKVGEMLGSLPEVPHIGFEMLLPKIPSTILSQIVSFFRAVHTKHGTEAAALIRWSTERNEHYVEIPGGPTGTKQEISGASVRYKPDPTNMDVIVMDIHSHHTMGAFFSGVDDGDEQGVQLYAVVGNIDHSQPTINIRARMHGEDVATPTVEEIFDMPHAEAFPESWMDKVEEPTKTWGDTGYEGVDWRSRYDVPSGAKWNERQMGESLADFAKRMEKIKRTARGSLPGEETYEAGTTIPTQAEDETDHEYLRRLRGGGQKTIGDLLNDPEVLREQEDIWQQVENAIIEKANLYQHSAVLSALRDYISDKINEMDSKDLRSWADEAPLENI